jgi:hypothetical protein
VRLQIPQNKIEKKLEEKYYKEAYEIEQVLLTNPTTYKLIEDKPIINNIIKKS